MARQQIEYGPIVATSAVSEALSRLDRIISEQMLAKEKGEAARVMAKEMALLNLMSNEFVKVRQEESAAKQLLWNQGINLPAEDRTHGYFDALTLVDEIHEMESNDFIDAIQQTTDNIDYLGDAYSNVIAGMEARRDYAMAQEDYQLTGGIDLTDPAAPVFQDEFAELSDKDKQRLSKDDYYRMGFEKGKLNKVEAAKVRETDLQIQAMEDNLRRGRVKDATTIKDQIVFSIGQTTAPNLNLGGMNLLSIQGLAGEDLTQYFEHLHELSNLPIEEKGAPDLASKLIGLVDSMNIKRTSKQGNPYEGIVYELGETYRLNEQFKGMVREYATANNISDLDAKDELLAKAVSGFEDNQFAEEVLDVFNQVRQRQNVGLWTDPTIMRQAYSTLLMHNEVMSGELDNILKQEGLSTSAILDSYTAAQPIGSLEQNEELNNLWNEYVNPESGLPSDNTVSFMHDFGGGMQASLKYVEETFSEEEILDEMNLIIDTRGLTSFNLTQDARTKIRQEAMANLEQINIDNKQKAINRAESTKSGTSLSRQMEEMEKRPGSFMGPGIW